MSGAVLLMDMGTGKTLTTIAVMGRAYLNEKIKKVLVVCILALTFAGKFNPSLALEPTSLGFQRTEQLILGLYIYRQSLLDYMNGSL